MTYEKALDVLHGLRPRGGIIPQTRAKMIDIADAAIRKQIPKKPDIEGDGYADGYLVYDTWICPCCGNYYEIDYDNYDYCPKCGQAIDWSEENESERLPDRQK